MPQPPAAAEDTADAVVADVAAEVDVVSPVAGGGTTAFDFDGCAELFEEEWLEVWPCWAIYAARGAVTRGGVLLGAFLPDFGIGAGAFSTTAPSGGNATSAGASLLPPTASRILVRELAHTEPFGRAASAFGSATLPPKPPPCSAPCPCCRTLVVVESQAPLVFPNIVAPRDDAAEVLDSGEPAAVVVLPPISEVSSAS